MAPLVPSSQNFADLQLQLYETEKERDDERETVTTLTMSCHELQGELRQETVSRLALRATVLTLQQALRESDALYEERALHCEKLDFRLSSLTYVDRGPLLDVPPKKKKKKKKGLKKKKKKDEGKTRSGSKKEKPHKEEKVDKAGKVEKAEKESSSSKRKRKKKKKTSKSEDGVKQEGETSTPPVDPTAARDESSTAEQKESPNIPPDESSTAAQKESLNVSQDESSPAAQNESPNVSQDESPIASHSKSIAEEEEASSLIDQAEDDEDEEEEETPPLVSADEVAIHLPPSEADSMDDPAGDEEEDSSDEDDYDEEESVDFDFETDDESVATEADEDDSSVGSFVEVDDDPAAVDESAIADSIHDGPVRAAFYQLLLQRDQAQLKRLQLQGQLRKSERKVEQLSDMLNQNSTVMQVSYSATTVDEQKTQNESIAELNDKVERSPAEHGVPEAKSAAPNLGHKFNMKNPSLKWLMKGQKIPQLNVPYHPTPHPSKVGSMRQKLFRAWSPTTETQLGGKRPANRGSSNTNNRPKSTPTVPKEVDYKTGPGDRLDI
jgi:hypothetical protein